jgi:metal-responsive CopG/Arc/MetJ family transcriptional regulator
MGKRVGFYLTDLQIKQLNTVSKKTGLTVSEIIRRAIDEYLEKREMKGKKVNYGNRYHYRKCDCWWCDYILLR